MEQLWKKILLGLGILVALPWGITAAISGKECLVKNQKVDWEVYLPILLCQQISWDYEEETLKAQAVLARSSLYLCLYEEKECASIWKNLMEEHEQKKNEDSYRLAFERMKQAVMETEGQVLTYNNVVCDGVFHKVSAGDTRDGIEILQNTSYGYLESVKSEEDILAETYLKGHYFSEEALKLRLNKYHPDIVWSEESLFEQIQIEQRDSAGYVTKIKLGNVEVSGEEFRVFMELSSSNFSIQEVNGKVRFLCKGLGHGLGMSQFGANNMAKKGSTYLNILTYYFPQAEVQKVNLQI